MNKKMISTVREGTISANGILHSEKNNVDYVPSDINL